MKRKYKSYLKFNLVTLVLVAISFISITFAWFAYSAIANVKTVVDVKAWYVELTKGEDTKPLYNNVPISLDNIYPGMETKTEIVNIKNYGDSDAELSYSIKSARILGDNADNYVVDDINVTSNYVEDILSHEYPFHININVSKKYIISKTGTATFEISISWPLDSGDNSSDSSWGMKAYEFERDETIPAIEIMINLSAKQYIESEKNSADKYNIGDTVIYDIDDNIICDSLNDETCIKTYVIDSVKNNNETTITLLADPLNNYINSTFDNYETNFTNYTNNWTVNKRELTVKDVLKFISKDVTGSFLIRESLSDSIIGYLNSDERINSELSKIYDNLNNPIGYYKFMYEKFSNISPVSCYWTNTSYDLNKGFAIKKFDSTISNLYGENKTTECNIVPVITFTVTNQ